MACLAIEHMNIDEEYLLNDVPEQMHMHLREQGTLLLPYFVEKDTLALITQLLGKTTWNYEKIPDKYSYEIGDVTHITAVLKTKQFEDFMSRVVGNDVRVANVTLKRFGHKDYTLLHDTEQKVPFEGVKFCYFFLDTVAGQAWDKNAGGMIVITNEHSDNPAIAVPDHNNLFLYTSDKHTLSFVKYVNHLARKNKFIVVEGELHHV